MSTFNREQAIKRLIELNYQLCQSDTTFNDQMLYDLLVNGFKGFNNMTDEELKTTLKNEEFEGGL
jgi:hypothetical protein